MFLFIIKCCCHFFYYSLECFYLFITIRMRVSFEPFYYSLECHRLTMCDGYLGISVGISVDMVLFLLLA